MARAAASKRVDAPSLIIAVRISVSTVEGAMSSSLSDLTCLGTHYPPREHLELTMGHGTSVPSRRTAFDTCFGEGDF